MPQNFRFQGPVRWIAGPGPAGITLLGLLCQADGESSAAQLSLMCSERPALPSTLTEVSVEALAVPDVVLRSGAQVWRLRCNTWQLHHDVGATFYAAVPPRSTPWTRRLGWGLLLAIADTAAGRWLLSRG
ncbi:MAG TPA: hypothetical protein VGV09_19870, partial [Steroidobacteraceae bacterium]|nr:hypothetical protein [Steroidobacteraceae bacterium]